MGTSNWQNISYNIDLIFRINPNRILDVGVGFGRWGVLFREFLELWNDRSYSDKWSRIIDGVEIFPDYIKPYHKYFYNDIYIKNALDFIKETEKRYDLINCGDVIEHFEKDEGLYFINRCLEISKYVLINIPIGDYWEQGITHDNLFQRHLSIWYNSDFKKYEYHKIKKFRDFHYRKFSVILLSKGKFEYKSDFKERFGKHFYSRNILKHVFHFKWLVEKIERGKKH